MLTHFVIKCIQSQFIAENGLRGTGAVASARAAKIYGLEVLAEGIQVGIWT